MAPESRIGVHRVYDLRAVVKTQLEIYSRFGQQPHEHARTPRGVKGKEDEIDPEVATEVAGMYDISREQ